MTKGRSRRQRQSSRSVVPDDGLRTNGCRPTNPLAPPGRLPIEVWMDIIGEYSRQVEWVTLCKASRFFHQIARICLYKRLNLDSPEEFCKTWYGGRDLRSSFGYLAPFEEALQARPELGLLIHELTLRIFPRYRIHFSPHALISKIDQLPNLERLVLRDSAVTAELRDAIYSLPHLRVLAFLGCILNDSLLTPRTHDYPQGSIIDLKLLSVRCGPSVPAGVWATFAPPGLRSLDLITHSKHDSNGILSNIMTSGNVLERLAIGHIPSSIIQRLVSSPRLRQLVINGTADISDAHLLSSLPDDSLPLLEKYSGPAKLLPILLRNRPVHTVTLIPAGKMDEDEWAIALDSLQLSLGPITTLIIHSNLEERWLSHIPITTRHLHFKDNKEKLEEPLFPGLSRLVDLHSISIRFPQVPSSKRFSRQDILKVSETCPSLREILTGWNETWRMTKPNVWEKFEHVADVPMLR